MSEKVPVSIQIEKDLKDQLVELAECENRSLSNMIEQILAANVRLK